MENYKTTQAQSHFEITVECPYCDKYQERTEDLVESLDYMELRAEECDKEITCKYCNEIFIVNEIYY